MSTTKNPLRQLASAIVKATQAAGAKGVKQSVVLDVLTKFEGFRSIQASDAAGQRHAEASPVPTTDPHAIFAQTFLYSVYPNSDLFGIDLNEIIGRTLTGEQAQEFGDPLFVSLWNTLTTAPADFIAHLGGLRDTALTLLTGLPEEDITPCSFTVYLPDDIQHFINTEYQESGNSLYHVLHRLWEDLDHIYQAMAESEFGFSLPCKGEASVFSAAQRTITLAMASEHPVSNTWTPGATQTGG